MKIIVQAAVVASLSVALLACNRDEPAPAAEVSGVSVSPSVQSRADSRLESMTVDQLRAALAQANAETRLYSPAGNSAFEYLLALRSKLPGDVSITSQLIDATPMLVAAIEQASTQTDAVEFERLMSLLRAADSANPSIAKLEAQRKQHLDRMARERAAAAAEQQRIAAQEKAAQEAARMKVESQAAAANSSKAASSTSSDRTPRDPAPPKRPVVHEPEEDRGVRTPSIADLRPITTPDPKYPPEALRNGTSGEVTIELTVGRDGSVIASRVVSSNPRRTFDSAALEAVRSWRYGAISSPITIRKTFSFKPEE